MNERNSYFDNAKFILILLVVFGHFIRSMIEDNYIMMNIYKFIYTFHMPAFILISGFFAKGFNKQGYVKKIAKKLILPYFIFHGIYTVYYVLIKGDNLLHSINPLNPHWSLWFLISLFFWNVMLIPFSKLNKLVALGLSFFIGIAAGYFDFISNYLSLSRTLVFFPIFLIGFYLKKEHFAMMTKLPARSLGASALLLTFVTYFYLPFEYEWLFGSMPYSAFGETDIFSGLVRLGFYFLTLITTFGFFSLIPKKRQFFTEWGTRTFYVYLLHGFIIQSFRDSELESWLTEIESITVFAIVSIVVTFLLSSRFVKTIAQPIIELRATMLKKIVKGL
ncbi:acyltransferase family protein [Aeribacillus composti]|uniref:acyltransferase family protein n=1 Tax=Aeribacillus composti TaxID=1868734 RepID=UPI002E1E262F|nr:acyltransferase family protein [Aeribacillus composti]